MKYTEARKHLSIRYLYFALVLCCLLIAALANSPVPTGAALKSPVGFYAGRLEITDCTQIKGWAWDVERPNDEILVDIYDGPNLIGTAPASRFRQDLYNAGMGNGRHGFVFPTLPSLKDGQLHLISAKFGGTDISLDGSPKKLACQASLFPGATPASLSSSSGVWEQGVEFSSSISGIIKEVRFWKMDEEVGGHTANIWSVSGGPALKSAPFYEFPGEGWQYATVNFPVTAGARYRVTYNVNYAVAKTFNVFNNGPIVSGPLTAWGSWYSKGAGTFPTTSSTDNFFVDIVFNAPR